MPETVPEKTPSEGLVRAIGRWSLAALTVNCIIGSGVFGLPSVLASLLGRASVVAVVLAAVAMACVGPFLLSLFGSGFSTGYATMLVVLAGLVLRAATLPVEYLLNITIAIRCGSMRWPHWSTSP